MSQNTKPAKGKDQETTHSAEEKASTICPPFTSEASTANTSAEGTSFFGVLPRELRDAVYDYTFEHFVKQQPDTDDGVTFHFHAPVSNLRLVSRQFRAEYDERYKTFSPRNILLTIVNKSRDGRRHWHSECPKLASRCRELKTICSLFDGRDEYTEFTHRDILRKLLTHTHNTTMLVQCMPNLRRVDMRFDFESLQHSGHPEDILRLFHRLALFKTWPVEGKYELYYQGLTQPQPDKLRELRVPNIDILDAPIVFASWNQAEQIEQIDLRELELRIRVEAAVLDAWKAKHGCTLWESKKLLREKDQSSVSRFE